MCFYEIFRMDLPGLLLFYLLYKNYFNMKGVCLKKRMSKNVCLKNESNIKTRLNYLHSILCGRKNAVFAWIFHSTRISYFYHMKSMSISQMVRTMSVIDRYFNA